jgi:AcrR family transcriptional regulator
MTKDVTRTGHAAEAATNAGRRGGRAGPLRDAYHHGDLRAALIAAAEEELAENGVDGFTLRGCARRAGVSHAAPAHHFKDVRALFTALATIGLRRLADVTEAFGREAPAGTADHFVAIGRGYVTFAVENPAYFRLIFRAGLLDRDNADFQAAGAAAFAVPVAAVGAAFGSSDPMADPGLAPIVVGLWSIVQGFSDLLLSDQFRKAVEGGDRRVLIERLLPPIIARFVSENAPFDPAAAGIKKPPDKPAAQSVPMNRRRAAGRRMKPQAS